MTLLRAIARPMLASMFAIEGARSLKDPESQAVQAKPITDRLVPMLQRVAPGAPIPTNPATWVRINGAVNLAGAAMLVSGRYPRLAATVLAANLVPATLTDHAFWAEPDPTSRATQRRHFVKNLSVAGGLVMAAAAPRGTKRSTRSARSKSKQDAG